jgi:hypothetical protein
VIYRLRLIRAANPVAERCTENRASSECNCINSGQYVHINDGAHFAGSPTLLCLLSGASSCAELASDIVAHRAPRQDRHQCRLASRESIGHAGNGGLTTIR